MTSPLVTGAWAAALAAACLLPGAARAGEGRGYAEVLVTGQAGVDGRAFRLVERLRPSFELALGERVHLVATVEAGLVQGRDPGDELRRTVEATALGTLLETLGCRWPAWRNDTLQVDGVSDYLEVDRLYADAYLPWLDLRVGRQAIHWGSASFLNPTDPFPEVLLAEPWRPRRGVNAVRATVPFAGRHDVSAVAAASDAFDEARAAGRLRLNFWEADWALVGAWRGGEDSGLVGVDLRGTLGVGWWVEGAWVLDDHPHEELAVGLDYSLPVFDRFVVLAQYYRNGAGGTGPDDYDRTRTLEGLRLPDCPCLEAVFPAAPAERRASAPFTLARDYLLLGATAAFHPDLSGSLFALQNLNDGTALVVPTVSWVAAGWLELSLSAQLPLATWGEGGELKPRPGDLTFGGQVNGTDVSLDLSGLVPEATLTLWTRASF